MFVPATSCAFISPTEFPPVFPFPLPLFLPCSLVTHEPHFCLLREVVSFTGGNRGQPAREVLDNPCKEHFVLLQIG
jgi:hypothetical protein